MKIDKNKNPKNILVFFGREHHAQKMSPVLDELIKRGHNITVLLADNSINIDPSTEYIHKYSYKYIHASDYKYDNEYVQKEVYSLLHKFLLNETVLKTVPIFWFVNAILESQKDIFRFYLILKNHKPDVVMALHANNFFTKILLYLAQELNIETVAFQEGLLRNRDQKTMKKQSSSADYVDKLFVWGELDRQAYLNAGVKTSVFAAGAAHLDKWIKEKNIYNKRKLYQKLGANYPLVVFAPPLLSRYEGDFVADFIAIAEFCFINSISLMLNLHPFDNYALQAVSELTAKYNVKIKPIGQSQYELMSLCDVLITQHSTMVVECALLGTPVIECNLSSKTLEPKNYAYKIENKDELSIIVDIIKGIKDTDIEKNIATLCGQNTLLVDGNSTSRIVDEITKTKR